MSKGGGQTQQVQSNEPWGPAQGHLRSIFGQASNIYGGPVGFNPQQYLAANPDVAAAVARGETNPFLHYNLFGQFENRSGVPANPTPPTGQSQDTQRIQQRIIDRSLGGSPLTSAAQNQVLGTLRGDFSNPFTSGALKDVMGMTKSAINSQFGGDNFGTSAHQEWLGRGLMSAAMPLAQGAFESERQRQLGAAAMAPGLAQQDLAELGTGLSVSRMADQAPWEHLFNYQRAVTGGAAGSGTSTASQDLHRNPVAGALGGALGGHALGQALGFTGPWGALIGAGLGLLG